MARPRVGSRAARSPARADQRTRDIDSDRAAPSDSRGTCRCRCTRRSLERCLLGRPRGPLQSVGRRGVPRGDIGGSGHGDAGRRGVVRPCACLIATPAPGPSGRASAGAGRRQCSGRDAESSGGARRSPSSFSSDPRPGSGSPGRRRAHRRPCRRPRRSCGCSATRKLAAVLDDQSAGTDDLAVPLGVARVRASKALAEASRSYLQILGAMGFTWEVDAHLCFRKAGATAVLLGSTTAHRRALARRLGLLREGERS
jgi:hypothetical protein